MFDTRVVVLKGFKVSDFGYEFSAVREAAQTSSLEGMETIVLL